ncbi:hypothetical protein ACHAWF_010141 [Thalassiosira exigua]
MGNELSGGGGEHDERYDALNSAVERGDLEAVKRCIETEGLSPDGPPGCSVWDRPLTVCADADNGGEGKAIARYLHSRGASGYDLQMAARVDDLDRAKELVDSGEEDLDGGRACGLIRDVCRSAGVARWLYDHAGEGSERDEAYDITRACELGDLERIKTLAGRPGFDVNAGYLMPMPGCGKDSFPYTTEDERKKINKRLQVKYGRTSDAMCTQVLYPLQAACMRQSPFKPEVAAYLIDELGASTEMLLEGSRRKDRKVTLCQSAAGLGYAEVVDFLLQKGAKAPWASGKEEAAECLIDAAALKTPERLQFLLGDEERAKCFDFSCRDKFGRTPLNLAVVLEREANVEFLLGRPGVVVSPDDVSAALSQSNASILTLLVENGGALPPNNAAVTMLSFQADGRARSVLELLHDRGADLTAPCVETENGKTRRYYAVHAATMDGAVSCLEFLFSVGADPDAVGWSPSDPDSREAGRADDWEGNPGLKYSQVYTDGYGITFPDKVEPVKALFERARGAKRKGKGKGKRSDKKPRKR